LIKNQTKVPGKKTDSERWSITGGFFKAAKEGGHYSVLRKGTKPHTKKIRLKPQGSPTQQMLRVKSQLAQGSGKSEKKKKAKVKKDVKGGGGMKNLFGQHKPKCGEGRVLGVVRKRKGVERSGHTRQE